MNLNKIGVLGRIVASVSIGPFITMQSTKFFQDKVIFISLIIINPERKEGDFPFLKQYEGRWMVSLGSLGTLDPDKMMPRQKLESMRPERGGAAEGQFPGYFFHS